MFICNYWAQFKYKICLSIVPYCKIPQTYSHSQFILSIYCFLLIIVVLSAVCLWRSRQWPLLRGTLIDLQVCWRGLHGLQDTWPRGLGCSGWRSVSGGRGHETLSTVTPSHLSPVSRLDFSDCLIDVHWYKELHWWVVLRIFAAKPPMWGFCRQVS